MLPRPPSVGLASKAGRKDGPRSQSAFWTLVPTPHAVPGGLSPRARGWKGIQPSLPAPRRKRARHSLGALSNGDASSP